MAESHADHGTEDYALIISIFEVQNNFIKKRITTKSSDRWSAFVSGQTSSPYNGTGGISFVLRSFYGQLLEHLVLCCPTVLPYNVFTVIAVAVAYSGQINDDDDDCLRCRKP